MTGFCLHLHSPAFAESARSPDHPPSAFTRARKLPLPILVTALLSFRGGIAQNELDGFFADLGVIDLSALASDRAPAKARSKLHVPVLWALNDRLFNVLADAGPLFARSKAAAKPVPAVRYLPPGWGAMRVFMCSADPRRCDWLSSTDTAQASTWAERSPPWPLACRGGAQLPEAAAGLEGREQAEPGAGAGP